MIALLLSLAVAADPAAAPFLARPRQGIPNTYAKLAAGQPVTIGYLGASITNGAGASKPELNWRGGTMAWFREQFPNQTLTELHHGSGGTTAALGAARVGRQYLAHDPDLMFVEYAVNDSGTPRQNAIDTMEGIVRQIFHHDATTDIVFIHTFTKATSPAYDQGACPPTILAFEEVAEHYGIPSINVGYAAWKVLNAGQMTWDDFAKDTVHPTDAGYAIYTGLIRDTLAAMPRATTVTPHPLPEPLSATNWERATLVSIAEVDHSADWQRVDEHNRRWENEWPAILQSGPGGTITFRFRGRSFGLYDVMAADSGMLEVTIDGVQRDRPINRWDTYCLRFDRSAATILADGLDDAEHTVVLRVSNQKAEESTGTMVRIGDLIINGNLLR